MPDDLRIFPDDFIPNVQASDAYKRWARSSPADCARWEAFRDALLADPEAAVAPVMSTKFGKALAAAGKEHMSISSLVGQVTNPYPPPVTPPPTGPMAVDRATMTASGGAILRNDNAAQADPFPGLWGSGDYQVLSRIQHFTSDGDARVQADGTAQGNLFYRRLNLVDGDNPGGFGERCDLSRNWWQAGENGPGQTAGTFALGYEGQRKITFWSMRFPSSFPMSVNTWQQVAQWKQAQPYDNPSIATRNPDGNGVAVEFQVYNNLFQLHTWWTPRWTTAAPPANTWIRMAADVTFSQWPNVGKVQLYIDNDGDGDWLDADEASPVWSGATMSYVTAAHNGLAVGDSVPSDFLIGIYRDSPVSGDTYVDIDNVQVYG